MDSGAYLAGISGYWVGHSSGSFAVKLLLKRGPGAQPGPRGITRNGFGEQELQRAARCLFRSRQEGRRGFPGCNVPSRRSGSSRSFGLPGGASGRCTPVPLFVINIIAIAIILKCAFPAFPAAIPLRTQFRKTLSSKALVHIKATSNLRLTLSATRKILPAARIFGLTLVTRNQSFTSFLHFARLFLRLFFGRRQIGLVPVAREVRYRKPRWRRRAFWPDAIFRNNRGKGFPRRLEKWRECIHEARSWKKNMT